MICLFSFVAPFIETQDGFGKILRHTRYRVNLMSIGVNVSHMKSGTSEKKNFIRIAIRI